MCSSGIHVPVSTMVGVATIAVMCIQLCLVPIKFEGKYNAKKIKRKNRMKEKNEEK